MRSSAGRAERRAASAATSPEERANALKYDVPMFSTPMPSRDVMQKFAEPRTSLCLLKSRALCG